jgi:hypothetical protein
MAKYHGEIERLVYAAEIHCTIKDRPNDWVRDFECDCPFNEKFIIGGWNRCTLAVLRRTYGDHVKQDDATEGKR